MRVLLFVVFAAALMACATNQDRERSPDAHLVRACGRFDDNPAWRHIATPARASEYRQFVGVDRYTEYPEIWLQRENGDVRLCRAQDSCEGSTTDFNRTPEGVITKVDEGEWICVS